VYYPWSVSNSGLGKLEEKGCNLFGYWNSTYDWSGNQGGRFQIEDINPGIGQYNQNKCARIDEILSWAEDRNLRMDFAIFPHDILSATIWATDWDDNAYNTICDCEDFFGDSLAWVYQEKQFRYIIARFGHSRALGFWEIVNEINGTDGWNQGYEADAGEWLSKVHNYLADNDPYRHPTTGSTSGGIWDYWWPEGYDVMDITNNHIYEHQGWPEEYPGNDLRSSLYNYFTATRDLVNNYNKPAIFGETGASATYEIHHNCIWVSLANGLSATPIWWEYGSGVSDAMLDQLKCLSEFVSDIDFAHLVLDSTGIGVPGCDAYALSSDTFAFGWIREIDGNPVGDKSLTLNGLEDEEYAVKWFNCWEGTVIGEDVIESASGVLSVSIPSFDSADIAFKASVYDPSGIYCEEEEGVGDIILLNDSPNLFRTETAISYILPRQMKVSVKIYDSSGRVVETLLNGEVQSSGRNTLNWNTQNVVSGVYFCSVETKSDRKTGKMTVLK